MRKTAFITLMSALVLTALSCSRRAANAGGETADTVYAVSIEPQRWLLEQLVDSGAEIVTLLPPGSNPETYEPSLSRRAMADRAAAFFATGALPFEQAFRATSDVPFVDTSEGIDPIYGTHDHGHDHDAAHQHNHGSPDPHFWTSLSGASIMAGNMTAALTELDPDRATVYGTRLAALIARLDSLDGVLADRLQSAPSRSFAVWHPSLSYFARDYGLHQIAVGQESKEMSARQAREAIDRARADSVRVFFFQKEFDSRQAEAINNGIGSRLITIDPLDYRLDLQLEAVADAIAHP